MHNLYCAYFILCIIHPHTMTDDTGNSKRSNGSCCVENSLRKGLWNCCETDYAIS